MLRDWLNNLPISELAKYYGIPSLILVLVLLCSLLIIAIRTNSKYVKISAILLFIAIIVSNAFIVIFPSNIDVNDMSQNSTFITFSRYISLGVILLYFNFFISLLLIKELRKSLILISALFYLVYTLYNSFGVVIIYSFQNNFEFGLHLFTMLILSFMYTLPMFIFSIRYRKLLRY